VVAILLQAISAFSEM